MFLKLSGIKVIRY